MLKGIIGAVFLAVVCTCLYGQQQSITTFIKEEAPVEVIPGMFTTYRSDKHIYWEIPDSLIGREFAVTTTILTAPARPDRDMEKKFGYAGDMIGPVFFSFRKQGDELWMMDPQYERVIENPEGTYAKIAAQRGNERLYKILPIKARNQGSSLIEIGEVLKDFPLFTLDIVSFDLLIGTRLREKDYIKEIKGYDNLLGKQAKRLNDANEACEKVNTKMEMLFVPYHFLQSVITKITGAVIVAGSAYFYINGTMSAVYAIGMTISAFMLYSSLECAGNYSSLLHVVSVCVDKANAILELDTMDIDGKEIQPENYDIRLSNVTFSYDKRKIIDDVSLSIPQKTTTAIVGPSGGGKSTLCNLIARFWDVDSGEVMLGGVNVKDYSMNSLMRNFSFVFQAVYLFADTIENNIKFGRQDASHEEVVEAAKKACCHDFISKLPDGYDTVIGEGGATLSGGEKQRISIARAIMKDAPIVILDEATANVDPENEKELMDAVDALTKEKTIIMIAHRLKTVRHADQIVVVDKGKIVQLGTHEQLMKQEGIYKRFVDARQQAVSWKLAR